MTMLLIVVLLLLALGGGGWGYSRYGLAGGLGPLGVALVVVVLLALTGNLHV